MIKVIGVPLLTIQMALVAFAPEAGAQGNANKPVPKTIPIKDVLMGPVIPGADTSSRDRQIKPRTNTSGDKAGFGGMSGTMDNWVYTDSAAAKGAGAKSLKATSGKQGIWLTPGFFGVQDDSTKGSGRKPRR